jgi:hypothetical protein
MTAEAKMRLLAQQSTELQVYFGDTSSALFRWFDRQLLPGYIERGTCARVLRVSTRLMYVHETEDRRSACRMEQPLFQIDVLDFSAERARSAAAAIEDWLATADFSSDAQFTSPVTSPTRHPNQVVNHRAGMITTPQPPVYVETLDVRIFTLED